jgi:D-threo-aldose 1-dehydrogenase
MFSAAALGDTCRVIPDQTKFEICGEWFRHVEPPVFIDATPGDDGSIAALQLLGRALRYFDIESEEVILHVKLRWKRGADGQISRGDESVAKTWETACHALGSNRRPQLLSIDEALLASAHSQTDRGRRAGRLDKVCRELCGLKAAGLVRGIGVVAKDWHVVEEICDAVPLDYVQLAGCLTILRHPPELLDLLKSLAERQIAVINSGVFHCGFLAGDQYFDGRALSNDDPVDQPLLAWRKSFAALCHGHGVTPTHACIQFALSAPGVVAVELNTTRPDRVGENVAAVRNGVPRALWDSMKEEGLLAEDDPYLE